MKKILFLVLPLFFLSCNSSKEKLADIVQEGDIIFQESASPQSEAIQLATHSKYSHCGIIFKTADECYVFEAAQPVHSTPIEEWIKRGKGGHYVVKRLKNAEKILTEKNLDKMKQIAGNFNDRDYDPYFEWDSKKVYCSELVWKVYKKSLDIELGQPERLQDLDLSSPIVKQKLKERYGNRIPKNQKVISPAAIFDSELLKTVISN